MCLYTTQREPAVADKDITCYKFVLKIRGIRPHQFISYFRSFRYEIGGEYITNNFQLKPDIMHSCPREINRGFHSYSKFYDALKEANSKSQMLSYEYVLLKCVIPAGTRYWKGSDYSETTSELCSEKIRIVAWKYLNEWNMKGKKWCGESGIEKNKK